MLNGGCEGAIETLGSATAPKSPVRGSLIIEHGESCAGAWTV